jgi:biotin synthase-like enzyme
VLYVQEDVCKGHPFEDRKRTLAELKSLFF